MSSFDGAFGSFSRRLRLIVAMLLEGANNTENGQKNNKGTFSLFRYKSNILLMKMIEKNIDSSCNMC